MSVSKHSSQFCFKIRTMNENELFFNTIQSGNIENLKAQLDRNPDLVNIKDARGFTPLIFASYFNKEDIVKTLMTYKAPVDETDSQGNTALIGVSFKGNTALAKYLMDHGANINSKNNNGVTPLIFATMYNQTKMVAFLLKHNPDVHIKDNDGKMALDYATEKGFKAIVELLE